MGFQRPGNALAVCGIIIISIFSNIQIIRCCEVGMYYSEFLGVCVNCSEPSEEPRKECSGIDVKLTTTGKLLGIRSKHFFILFCLGYKI